MSCVFCDIVCGKAPAHVVREWSDAVAFVPLNPCSDDHTLVVPRVHVADFATDPEVSAAAMKRAAELASPGQHVSVNIGPGAGQTVFHLHVHVWSCTGSDMPWEPK
ncbi:HIT domain-containing protein [Nocardiopsis sp. NPDC101807]|uniref:HIT domain-containing protein n=1 Tax=Nocardiopsis sp. NPDC101807 TaxID=3364339 RepID=UPI00380DA960